jgi:asparagine synthase (glutamine-hydrolysing)
VAGLPLNLKLRDGWTKYVLRRGGQNKMPEQILTRRDKLGFATPEDDWFRQALAADFHDTFTQPIFLPKFVQMTALQQEFEAYVKGQRPLLSSDFFFRFFILEHWARTFILP